MTKKAERLLDLVTFLLDQSRPVSREEIFNAFPDDYGAGDEADQRKFERDKADLLELGIPLQYTEGDDFSEGGYQIDRAQYRLPELDLAPEELAMLFLAGAAVLQLEGCPFSRDLLLALNKIAYSAGDQGLMVPRGWWPNRPQGESFLRRQEKLEKLHRAVLQRKKVFLVYNSFWRAEQTRRWVDPYGLVFSRSDPVGVVFGRSEWFLVGHCHLRGEIRVFHVDRITALEVNPEKPSQPDFDVPQGLRLREQVAVFPWQIRAHPPRPVEILFQPPLAQAAATELRSAAERIDEAGEARLVHLQATFLDGLLPTVLWYRGRAKVLRPPELVQKVTEALARLAGEGR